MWHRRAASRSRHRHRSGAGNRLVVEVGVWSGSNATTASVTDSAGDTFTEVSHFTGPDQTEQSVWTAPITAGAGNDPTVTAKFSSAASAAITALEYSGLSTAAGAAAVDQTGQRFRHHLCRGVGLLRAIPRPRAQPTNWLSASTPTRASVTP